LTADLEAGRQSIARRIPVGVIGIITPWNSPFIPGARAIGPALAMGNAVILKPDVQTPVAGGVNFAQEYLEGTFRVGFTREKRLLKPNARQEIGKKGKTGQQSLVAPSIVSRSL
jgi:hypothetical protein